MTFVSMTKCAATGRTGPYSGLNVRDSCHTDICGVASTCVCSFNYKTSLALIPVERHESWGIHLRGNELAQGVGSAGKGGEKIVGRPAEFNRLRINLNAPGDHYDDAAGAVSSPGRKRPAPGKTPSSCRWKGISTLTGSVSTPISPP